MVFNPLMLQPVMPDDRYEKLANNLLIGLGSGYNLYRQSVQDAELKKQQLLNDQFNRMRIEREQKEIDKLNNPLFDFQRLNENLPSIQQSDYFKNLKPFEQSKLIKNLGEQSLGVKPSRLSENFGVGPLKNIFALEQIKDQYGEDSPQYKEAKKLIDLEAKHTESTIEKNTNYNKSKNYASLSPTAKKDIDAIFRGAGIPIYEGVKMLSDGASLEDIGELYGVDVSSVKPIYSITTPNLTQIQSRKGNEAEVKAISKEINPYIEMVAKRYGPYSPKLIKEMVGIGTLSKSEIGKILGANALQTEINASRLKLAGVNPTVYALKLFDTKINPELKTLDMLNDPEIKRSTLNFINDVLEKGVNAYTNEIESYTQPKEMRKKKSLLNEDIPPPFMKKDNIQEKKEEPKRIRFKI